MRIFPWVALFSLLMAPMQSPAATPTQTPLTLSQVVQKMIDRNIARARALESFEVKRTYTLSYKGFHSNLHAEVVADMTYTAPDTKVFHIVSESGPKLLVNEVIKKLIKAEVDASNAENKKRVDLNTENYTFSNLAYQPEADGCSYSVSVEPKTPTKYLYRGEVWINDRDFAVCRINVEPAKNPSFWITGTTINHVYEKVGDFWLPEKNKSVSTIRIGGHATLMILYDDYKILKAEPLAQ
ncbi:MAG: hypothetical protein HIU93_07890 [Acidobacteria bacterium]|nr:hypothetical protein [Acidobacteriota bacterium]